MGFIDGIAKKYFSSVTMSCDNFVAQASDDPEFEHLLIGDNCMINFGTLRVGMDEFKARGRLDASHL